LFGYHALFFLALRLAPPAEAQLVNYSWPLLVVLFSALLPGEHLKSHHVAGALIALAGTAVLFFGAAASASRRIICPASRRRSSRHSPGRSIRSRRAVRRGADRHGRGVLSRDRGARRDLPPDVRSDALAATAAQWLAVLGLGIGPVGAAFYAWDIGMKHGDIRILGAGSYLAPLLSTAFLVLAGYAAASARLRWRPR
jgi:drug/metabolite transporter (DMT)-like permease